MINRFIYTLHKILGTILSILFLMWFLTGIVMIYHQFPSANRDEKMAKYDALPDSLPSIDNIAQRLTNKKPKRLSVYSYLGKTYFSASEEISTRSRNGNPERLMADSTQIIPVVNADYINKVAALWCDGPIAKVDTLNKLEQWIPFDRLKKDFPIYKFYFSDKDRTQLYISSITGEVLQQTTHAERIWAWIGAIPHWVYFTWLRHDVDLWKDVIIWISIIGIFMLIAGFYIAIRSFRISVKRGKGLSSPYKKKWYRYHHIYGTIFGIFLLTWILSGMYSLTDTPKWLGKEYKEYPSHKIMSQGVLPLNEYKLDYRNVIHQYTGKVTQITWSSFYNIPIYQIQLKGEDKMLYVDASENSIVSLDITKKIVTDAIQKTHGNEPFTITKMTEYDNYYLDRKGKLDLPVWKVKVDNADNTVYYINPNTGNFRSVNNHSRWHFLLYQGFHSLRYKVFIGHNTLWTVVMWGLLLAGAFVSLTGLVLGIKYIIRLFKKPNKLNNTNN
ncbi:MAG: PepSY domain-containing protein [Phocaeicola sp.]|uniref:PepSY domain-containing protein n=1 Tax=Phocaeicola TaxID=909656 RepID=UPI00234E62F0|nr:PepSY domain-containing protein [Phocaeicola oris]MCE2615554.1 PepSY domain-containing protein [Phocaeicola oris]